MKKVNTLLLLLFCSISYISAQESDDYIEFDDRKNVVHGVYLGITAHYGQLRNQDTYFAGAKVAYVANRQFEIGVAAVGLYSQQDLNIASFLDYDLVGVYGGLHLEPILFSKSKFNLSFPLLVGGGALGYLNGEIDNENTDIEDWDAIFVAEPGVNILYNISRYIQLEMGVKYRFSSDVNFTFSPIRRINGFSGGLGIKVGVFNLGRRKYKKLSNGN